MTEARAVASYLMNPAEDAIVFGSELTDGMWVLPEDRTGRLRAGEPEEMRLRAQRFRRVTRLAESADGKTLTFVGEWVDGYQEVHRCSPAMSWLAKKDPMPSDGVQDAAG